jgi:hypothetical protein
LILSFHLIRPGNQIRSHLPFARFTTFDPLLSVRVHSVLPILTAANPAATIAAFGPFFVTFLVDRVISAESSLPFDVLFVFIVPNLGISCISVTRCSGTSVPRPFTQEWP